MALTEIIPDYTTHLDNKHSTFVHNSKRKKVSRESFNIPCENSIHMVDVTNRAKIKQKQYNRGQNRKGMYV